MKEFSLRLTSRMSCELLCPLMVKGQLRPQSHCFFIYYLKLLVIILFKLASSEYLLMLK